MQQKAIYGAPDLMLEVISPNDRPSDIMALEIDYRAIGVPEIGTGLFFLGLFLLAWAWFAGRYPILSPRLAADALEREAH